jgi:hypothetical protein
MDTQQARLNRCKELFNLSLEILGPLIVKGTIMDMPQNGSVGTDINTTLSIRQGTHGDFRTNGYIMQKLKDQLRAMDGWKKLSPEQREALDMICHKMGRILTGNPNEPDHWHDISGYAKLVENIIRTGKSHPSA